MIGLAALCLAGSLGVALLILLAARAAGWRRRRIDILARPWLLAVLILLTIGLTAEIRGGIGELSSIGWILAGGWLGASLSAHVVGRASRRPDPARLWGSRVAHFGIAIALAGIMLSSWFTATIQRPLAPGETVRFGAWTVQLHDVWPAAGEGWAGLSAELRASSGEGVTIIEPQQRILFTGSSRAEPAKIDSGTGELVATLGPRGADGRWPIGLRWTPLLILAPLGLVIAMLGCVGAMIGPSILRRRRLRQAQLATAWWA